MSPPPSSKPHPHLGGRDDELAGNVGLCDHHLLGQGDLLRWDLHPEVPAGHHHSVGDLEDLVEVLQASGVLDLGDDLDLGR